MLKQSLRMMSLLGGFPSRHFFSESWYSKWAGRWGVPLGGTPSCSTLEDSGPPPALTSEPDEDGWSKGLRLSSYNTNLKMYSTRPEYGGKMVHAYVCRAKLSSSIFHKSTYIFCKQFTAMRKQIQISVQRKNSTHTTFWKLERRLFSQIFSWVPQPLKWR